MQIEITQPGPLLQDNGHLTQVGWSRQPLLECNLEKAHFYRLRPFQRFRIKRWDYYAVFTPQRFFSATIADLGYAGNIFVYTLDFATNELYEEGLVIPFGNGMRIPRDSTSGETVLKNKKVTLRFQVDGDTRRIFVDWPVFQKGRGIKAEVTMVCPSTHESMNIVIPIGQSRFYFNRKVNCMPASGTIQYGDVHENLAPDHCLASLDWGRGVWDYQSFWNWASASGYLSDGSTVGLNFGCGFGDLSRASENCLLLNGHLHKLDEVSFDYQSGDYMKPWHFTDNQGCLELSFTPFKERIARTDLGVITSEVHQMFGRYAGRVILEGGQIVEIHDLIGFAEEHQARW